MSERFLPVDASGMRVVVTAAASGIGRTIAEAFRARGARVYICDVNGKAIDQALAEGAGLLGAIADVSRSDQVEALFDHVAGELGGLDVLVNNAGIAGPTAPVEEIGDEGFAATLAVNVQGQFYACRRAVPMLKAAGGGSIINLGSVASRLCFPMRTPYSASKWGVIGFTKSLAVELGSHGIRANAILPGHVESDRFHKTVAVKAERLGKTGPELEREYLSYVSLGRTVSKEDIANMALYLASPFGAAITGQAISVCGNVELLR